MYLGVAAAITAACADDGCSSDGVVVYKYVDIEVLSLLSLSRSLGEDVFVSTAI